MLAATLALVAGCAPTGRPGCAGGTTAAGSPPPATAEPTMVVGEPATYTVGPLTVEEYPLPDVPPDDYPPMGEPPEWVLARRRTWREAAPTNPLPDTLATLERFGYEFRPMDGRDGYVLYHRGDWLGNKVRLHGSLAVSASGRDVAQRVSGPVPGDLLRPDGLQQWDGLLSPVFVGDDLVWLESLSPATEANGWMETLGVRRAGELVYTFQVWMAIEGGGVDGLWTWDGQWVVEAEGRLVVDGRDVTEEWGYTAIEGWRSLEGEPFFFGFRGDDVLLSCDGQALEPGYDRTLRRNRCCSTWHVGANDTMVWFYGRRGGTWHYVEAGVY